MEKRLETMKNIVYEVVSRELSIPISCIDENTSYENVASWDSVTQINILLALEAAFKVDFDFENVMQMLSVDGILQVLQQMKDET